MIIGTKKFLRVKRTIKIFITLFCVLQVGVLLFAIVSPDLHLLVFHNQQADRDSHLSASCAGHSQGNNWPEHDQTPDSDKYCPLITFSQGLDIQKSHISDNWKYADYISLQFSEPKSLYSSVCTSFIRLRAPPLS